MSFTWVFSYIGGLIAQLYPTIFWPPWTVARQAPLSMGISWARMLSYHVLLQGIFPTRGSNLRLPHLLLCGLSLSPLSHQGSPVYVQHISVLDWPCLTYLIATRVAPVLDCAGREYSAAEFRFNIISGRESWIHGNRIFVTWCPSWHYYPVPRAGARNDSS